MVGPFQPLDYVCCPHVSVLLDKHISIFDIESDCFIQAAADGPEYDRRRAMKERGLGVLGALELMCDRDFEDAERKLAHLEESLLQAVHESMNEIRRKIQQRNEGIRQALDQVKARLKKLTGIETLTSVLWMSLYAKLSKMLRCFAVSWRTALRQ